VAVLVRLDSEHHPAEIRGRWRLVVGFGKCNVLGPLCSRLPKKLQPGLSNVCVARWSKAEGGRQSLRCCLCRRGCVCSPLPYEPLGLPQVHRFGAAAWIIPT
jgi:hypothetical protein